MSNDNTLNLCAAVGLKQSQILEHFQHLFLYLPCHCCKQLTGLDPKVIIKTAQLCIEQKLIPITLCSDCHDYTEPHNVYDLQDHELENKIDKIIAERN